MFPLLLYNYCHVTGNPLFPKGVLKLFALVLVTVAVTVAGCARSMSPNEPLTYRLYAESLKPRTPADRVARIQARQTVHIYRHKSRSTSTRPKTSNLDEF